MTCGALREPGKIGRVLVRLAVLMLTLSLAACASAPVKRSAQHPDHGPVSMGETFTLTLGDGARIGNSLAMIVFDSVVEDSRCPRDVHCFWEGNARVKLYLLEPTGEESPETVIAAQTLELNTSSRFEKRARVPGGYIELRGIEPQRPITDAKKYLVTLFLEAGQ